MAYIALGITCNATMVLCYALRQLVHDRAYGRPIGSYWDRASREQHRRENPHMLRDTVSLTFATLVPFVLFLAVLFDIPWQQKP